MMRFPGGVWEYPYFAGPWFARMNREQAERRASELGLVIHWAYNGAPAIRAA